jgi:hypothetical protein
MTTYISIHGVESIEIGKKELEKSKKLGEYYFQKIIVRMNNQEENTELNLFYQDKE